MKNLFSPTLNIKYADWPFILQLLIAFAILISLSNYFFQGRLLSSVLVLLFIFFVVLTIVHHYRLQSQELEYSHYKIQAIGEIQKLLSFRAPLPPMNGWAATPELAVTVLKEIIRSRPNLIVELGSGVTTLINAYGLEKFNPNGKVISIDHDKDYAGSTKNEIKLHRLNKFVELRIAPLKNVDLRGSMLTWYDTSSLKFDQKIDLLIVDGPPVKTEKQARYPALPILHQHLSESCTIIIHDTQRNQESAIVKRWLQEFPSFSETRFRTEKGITVLRK